MQITKQRSMKDSATSYDLAHHQQQQQQHPWNSFQRQQQQPQQHQQHQTQQQQHQAHAASLYASLYASQRNAHGLQQQQQPAGHQQQQQQQQQQQHAAQVGQYQHHHVAAAQAAVAHYQAAYQHVHQQAHVYPNYQAHGHSQDQQQHSASADHHAHAHHHQHHASSLTNASSAAGSATGSGGEGTSATATANSSVIDAGVANTQHQHGSVHQATTDSQQTSLNHSGWSPSVGSLGPQAHHAVVTDHSTLAYHAVTHPYQSHSSTVGDHHRSSNGHIANQTIGNAAAAAAQQASTYSVDSLYNTSTVAAAAAAAYGYNSYNAAFFQTSTNNPHTQTGHPSASNISTFWGHNQTTQQRAAHTQAVANQPTVQQRQAIVSETAANYMHDPRLYYGRPYGQGIQNYNQHHAQSESMQHRLATMANQHQQQNQLVQHEQQQQQQQQQQQTLHQAANQEHTLSRSPIASPQQSNVTNQSQQAFLGQAQILDNQPIGYQQNQSQRKTSSSKTLGQHHLQKQALSDVELAQETKNHLDQVAQSSTQHQKNTETQKPLQNHSGKDKDANTQDSHKIVAKTTPNAVTNDSVPQQTNSSNSAGRNQASRKISESDSNSSYQRKPLSSANTSQTRNIFCAAQEERMKMSAQDSYKRSSDEKDARGGASDYKNQGSSTTQAKHQENDQSLEDSMNSLALSARKTTWASIASQPAKVSQPKSLRSKIAGSNSVLSSAKHFASVSLDNSNLESKNGINPAIKSSVSAAATSIQRSSVPPPVSKITPAVANLNLKLLGDEPSEKSKISWPAVNASLSLSLAKEASSQKEASDNVTSSITSESQKKDDGYNNPDYRDSSYKDHNHNQGPKMVNAYQPPINRNRRDDNWNRRDNRMMRDSDRREQYENNDRKNNHPDDQRDMVLQRRDYKPGGRNQYRNDDYRERDHKRSAMINRDEHRNNDFYQNQRYPPNKNDSGDQPNHLPLSQKQNDDAITKPNHHHNNVRDSSSATTKTNLNAHQNLNPANFNPKTFDLEPVNARYFIIKSYSEDDIHRSIKYAIWCSTNHGNRRLDEAYRQQEGKGPLYLFFSVNGSGHFCGMAQMTSSVDFDSSSGVWAQNKWQGEFSVKWIYVKDVPNNALRHITLENNEDKPVTNSRDTQEVPSEKGKAVLKIIHQFMHKTSLFDDFSHYERRQEEEKLKKSHMEQPHHRLDDRERGPSGGGGGHRGFGRPFVNARPYNDYPSNRDRSARYVSRD